MAGKGVVKHGHSFSGNQSTEYRIWAGIKSRCTDAASRNYRRYGGRGIVVCDRWRDSFVNFLADMGPRPSKLHSVERIDNDGNYEPKNCKWATRAEQALNTRRSRLLEINGELKNMAVWAREAGIAPQLIYHRLKFGWTPKDAVFTPPNKRITGRPCA
jgi:hypothetical protein